MAQGVLDLEHEVIPKLQAYFATQPVRRAYIFGSYARGQADADSDLDVLVELDPTVGLAFGGMYMDLQEMFGCKVDLLSINGLSKYIARYIEADKRLFYEKQHSIIT